MQLVSAVKSLMKSAEVLSAIKDEKDLPVNFDKGIEDNMGLLQATMKLGEK